MRKGIRFRIYPTKPQRKKIQETLGSCRLVYNKALNLHKQAEQTDEYVGYQQTYVMLLKMKQQPEYQFLNEIEPIFIQQALRNLDRNFTRYRSKLTKYPVFKSKHAVKQTMTALNRNNCIHVEQNRISFPGIGWIKFVKTMEITQIYAATITKTNTNRYYISLNVEYVPTHHYHPEGTIGIDVGIKTFYADSNGKKISNPKYLERCERKLIREQRKLSRRKKHSHNWEKQRFKVAKIYEKIENKREDFLQKQSTRLIRKNKVICIETLDISEMINRKTISKFIASASWGKFFEMLKYKAKWYGTKLIQVPATYPSSQTCSCCGTVNPHIRNLAIRRWECPNCHQIHDRDTNAAINILHKGLSLI